MRKLAIAVLATALLGGGLYLMAYTPAAAEDVTLYKTPQCGCCLAYADYLRANGFEVTVESTHELVTMSRQAGIPDGFEGCHLAFIDGYVVSGHVPVGTVDRLLTERPAIAGVTLPGMPMGSPGMSGAKSEPFTMYAIGDQPPAVFTIE